jgi:hypothetical protein
MKLDQNNGFVRFILRAIDLFVGLYIPRRVRWEEQPFQKATRWEKRFGGLFMVIIPAIFLCVAAGLKDFDRALDSMMYGHHSIIWLYVGFFVFAGAMLGIVLVVGPKIPLFVTVPVAILMWAILAWYAWTNLI